MKVSFSLKDSVLRKILLVHFIVFLTLFQQSLCFADFLLNLPQNNKYPANQVILEPLQIYSQALAELATLTKRAVVFVSVSKRIEGRPLGAIDPYELFRNRKNFLTAPEEIETLAEPIKPFGMGSGFFIDLDSGYIVTNYHVIKNAEVISLRLANDTVEDARLIGKDIHADLVVLQIINKNFNKQGLDHLVFDDLKTTREGELVMVAGSPFGLEGSLSLGIVSAIGRGNLQITRVGDFLQTDAAVNPGNSGGPLVNVSGKVIGINTAIFTRSGGSSGINFAIPAPLAVKTLGEIIKHGKVRRGFLGVNVQKLDQELRELLGIDAKISGVLVQNIAKGSPAEKIKFKIGDVITRVNGQEITDESAFFNSLANLSPHSKVSVEVLRGKKTFKVSVHLGEWPEEESLILASENKPSSASAQFGFWVSTLNKDIRKKYALPNVGGVLVKQVKSGSRAERTGLKDLDIILAFNEESLKNPDQLQYLLSKHKRFVLKVFRRGNIFFLPFSG